MNGKGQTPAYERKPPVTNFGSLFGRIHKRIAVPTKNNGGFAAGVLPGPFKNGKT
jgi:hypothetical protein